MAEVYNFSLYLGSGVSRMDWGGLCCLLVLNEIASEDLKVMGLDQAGLLRELRGHN